MFRRTTPIDGLPAELLSYIFLLGAYRPPDEDPLAENPGGEVNYLSPCMTYSYAFPCLVAAVSRHWRGVALSTGQLWNKIPVTDEDTDDLNDLEGTSFKLARLFLSRSGTAPLDIMVDARDPEWDFSEFDTSTAGSTPGADDEDEKEYRHPFTEGHMHAAMQMLLPHLHRTRSLAIFTDRWVPMHIVLESLSNDAPLAPMLESLILMRCNEFAAYAPDFTPEEYAGHWLLPFSNHAGGLALLRLQRLILSGVHFKWKSFPALLSQPASLRHLELGYHCSDVRPNKVELYKMLSVCSKLEELNIRVSLPEDEAEFGQEATMHGVEPVVLSRLKTLKLGYDDCILAEEFLELFRAPNLQTFVLDDASYAAAEVEQEASKLLVHVAHPGGRRSRAKPLFPLLETLELGGTRATQEAFQILYYALTRLRTLTLRETPVASTRALRPSSPFAPQQTCPCPLLDTLIVRGFEPCEDPLLSEILVERTNYGAVFRDIRLEPWFGTPEDDDDVEDRPVDNEPVGEWLMPNGQPVPPVSPVTAMQPVPRAADGRVLVGRAGLPPPTPFEFVIGRMSAGPAGYR
ncbi:hypothetical protein DAEQUDRAFT_810088 [Daedalea quercina L-15889]|uniref:Uncharacterized protein n=1 Tax=Daedalea quercina L-15889 TaxID=1314783 RepID=A0A165RRR5_9APHY|nr:hypothetical protein DAEQUDRAFT_810088 [Daedalea quercina L-15889]